MIISILLLSSLSGITCTFSAAGHRSFTSSTFFSPSNNNKVGILRHLNNGDQNALMFRGGATTPSASASISKSTSTTTSTTDLKLSSPGNSNEESPLETTPTISSPLLTTTTSSSVDVISIMSGFDFGHSPLETVLLTALNITTPLDSHLTNGLSTSSFTERLSFYGPNKLTEPPPTSLLQLLLHQLDDDLVRVLGCVAILSSFFSFLDAEVSPKSFLEPLSIILILILNALVGVWQESSALGSLEALKKLQSSTANVIRSGVLSERDASDLVPGDIIVVRTGDKIPADARLLSVLGSALRVDESSLTGESVTIDKTAMGCSDIPNAPLQDQVGMLFGGTVVTSGSGRALVVKTSVFTEMGKIQAGVMEARASTPQKTPLGIQLDAFSHTLTKLISFICLLVWVLSIPKFGDASFKNELEGAVYYAKVAIALGVAAIPEGLPAVITLCLSLGTRKMAQRNVIVRKLPSVETLGCVSVICTDKTGTLTKGEMTVRSLVLVDEGEDVVEREVTGYGYDINGTVIVEEQNQNYYNQSVEDVMLISSLCNDAQIIGCDEEDAQNYTRVGEPTEAALCVLVEKLCKKQTQTDPHHLLPSALASATVDGLRNEYHRVATLEFTRDRKSMSVVVKNNDMNQVSNHSTPMKLLTKGAPSLLFPRCSHIKLLDGSIVPLTPELRLSLESKTSELSKRPLRCLALAYKLIHDHDTIHNDEFQDPTKFASIETDLIFVGLVGIVDPARPQVRQSILQCQEAGIRIIMITGDAKDTAVSIARDVGIIPTHNQTQDTTTHSPILAFEGRQFFSFPEQKQLDLLSQPSNLIFCRAEPSDKLHLIQLLQRLGEIPAMTGDGVNDAPALQQAAIGIAMGISGTEVSKEASDMILADDDFSTIVSAVEEGRRIYANMQSFIAFLISCNIGEIFAILIATLAGFPEPLTAMHLLWVNLVTDGPPATALGFNPPGPEIMKRMPRKKDEKILTDWLLIRYCLTGLYVGLATVGVFVVSYLDSGVSLGELGDWSKCGETWNSPAGTTCQELFGPAGRALPQTLSLTTLVCMEMLKALSAVSVNNSIFTVGPQRNKWLLLGVSVPFLLHLAVIYSDKWGADILGESFGLVSLTWNDWLTILKWSAPILIVDEVLKAIGRYIEQDEDDKERSSSAVASQQAGSAMMTTSSKEDNEQ